MAFFPALTRFFQVLEAPDAFCSFATVGHQVFPEPTIIMQ